MEAGHNLFCVLIWLQWNSILLSIHTHTHGITCTCAHTFTYNVIIIIMYTLTNGYFLHTFMIASYTHHQSVPCISVLNFYILLYFSSLRQISESNCCHCWRSCWRIGWHSFDSFAGVYYCSSDPGFKEKR